MTVEERVKNNKIVKSRIRYVLVLLRKYMDSLAGNKLNRDHYLDLLERNNKHKDQFTVDQLISIQINIKNMINSHQELFIKDAIDLYEFFYLKWKPGDSGYNYNNFPLDEKEFKQKIYPKKKIEKLLKNPIDNDGEIVRCMNKNEKILRSYFKKELKNKK
jgi:hypothetical protein